jgi:PAS domain-containing protein
MVARITDIDFSSGFKDFAIRKRYPTISQIFVMFLSTVLIGASVSFAITDRLALISILFILGGSAAWYMAALTQRNRDQLLATEFQNALFSSALGVNHKFCFIIKRDGSIIYEDSSFQEMFPEFAKQSKRSLDVLMDYGKVSREDKDKIFAAIERGTFDKAIFNIRGGDGQLQRIVMTMEPILRPSGFVLMRGREFIQSRNSDNASHDSASTLFNKSTMHLFSSVMDVMNMGIYMTNPAGQVIYLNPLLTKWLEYNHDEIASGELSLSDLLYASAAQTGFTQPENYEGELSLKKKTGGLVKCYVNQKIIFDDHNKMVGCTGLVHHLAEHTPDYQKNNSGF